ncbi:hypothetical protein BMR04_05235 [Methylococcaceae bacterium HT3]|uniref:hypothetical protein n=1 Tax=Bathymodiolus platifrons methanotrophic gill symbiont TaxID=113268 RepID=UPI000B4193EB|nr:hypothetical protein [Bathymodiolus platifrons methanotrophic gill symbiont]TXL17555.1 hypothetical protein BMR04_05235 [Methylococcaceae bacterium HT3]
MQHSNPVDTYNAYSAPGTDTSLFATATDPMIGKVVGGVNVFGGGLALYTTDGLLGLLKLVRLVSLVIPHVQTIQLHGKLEKH